VSDALVSAMRMAMPKRLPLAVHIDLLARCDLNCTHCYLSVRRAPGLSTDRYLQLLDELHDANVLHLLFSGGEIFLRDDTLQILRRARQLRFLVKLITHGGRITDEIADALAEMGIAEVGISLYSMVPEHHEAVTRIKGSHARTLAGIRRLRARDVAVQLKVTAMQANRDSWHTVRPWGQEAGCLVSESNEVYAKDDFDAEHVERMNLNWEERVAAASHQLAVRRDQDGLVAYPDSPGARLEDPPCTAGQTSCYINPEGKVYPCAIFYSEVGDITRQSFREIWEDSPALHKIREVSKLSFHECQDCRFIADCNHCLAQQFQATGDMLARSPLICTDTHARFAAAAELNLYDGVVEPPPHGIGVPSRPPCASDTAMIGAGGEGCDSCGPSEAAGAAFSESAFPAGLAPEEVPDLLALAVR
jgi:radical SAM protein with 4Fe4S-binding SPASM domain